VRPNTIELQPEPDDEWKELKADDVNVFWTTSAGSSELEKALGIDLSVIGEQDE